MEMVWGGIAAMLLGWWAGRLMKLRDEDVCTVMGIAGGGSIIVGLPWLWISNTIAGQDGNIIEWGLIGLVGGVLGIVVYIMTRGLDWFVDLLKRNGML